ncbi:MAG TPA: hypothetical protein PKO22_01310 [Treponemataceae bacterium]|nr:hypothetical protein [Treponemataceae bacterium]
MGMANLSPFSPTKLAFTGDIGFAGKLFRTGISCFLGDPSFVTLDGTLLKIRQSGCASGSIRIPLPGGPSEELAAGAAFTVKRTTNLSMSEGGETLFSGGGELKATLNNLHASLKTDTDDEETKISAKLGIPELFTPILRVDLSGNVSFPHSQFSPETWSDGTVSTKLKIARIGPLAAELQGIFCKSKPQSPLGIEVIARVNLAFDDSLADWMIVASVSSKPLKSDYEGSLSVRADFP